MKRTLFIFMLSLCGAANAGADEGNAAYRNKDYASALREWSASAEQGDPEAQFQLGKFYRTIMQALPLDKDGNLANDGKSDKEPKFYETTAPQLVPCGVAIAAGTTNREELEFRIKYQKSAQSLFEKSAAQGNPKAEYCLGILKFAPLNPPKQEDYPQAIRFLTDSAKQGYAPAEGILAYAYREGRGVEKDPATALRWLKSAAAHGSPFAQAELGYDYELGNGVARDYDEAENWCGRAAQADGLTLGGPNYCLGMLYLTGPQKFHNSRKALALLRTSAVHGSSGARRLLGQAYLDGAVFVDGTTIQPDPILAYVYLSWPGLPGDPNDLPKFTKASQALSATQKSLADNILQAFKAGTEAPERVSEAPQRTSVPQRTPTARFANLFSCKPNYPRASIIAEEEGTVHLQFVVNADNALESATVVRSSGHPALDAETLRALSKCKFIAAVDKDGTSIRSIMPAEYIWKLP